MTQSMIDARTYADKLMENTQINFRRYAIGHPFIQELADGTLSLQQVKGFFLNWYTWVFEINMATAQWLHRFGPILKIHHDIMAIVNDKIADELITPDKYGHIKTLETL